jgi:DNA-binding Lrp family transcriptional regulator
VLLGPRFHKICWDSYVSRQVPITPQIRSIAAMRLAPPGSHIRGVLRGRVPPDRMRDLVASIPEVVEAYTVTGEADGILRVRASDTG